jgi:hypothetical protein
MRTDRETQPVEARHADPDDQFAPPPLVLLVVRLLLMVFSEIEDAIAWIEGYTGRSFAIPAMLSPHRYRPHNETAASLEVLCGNHGVLAAHSSTSAPQPIRLWQPFDPGRLPSHSPPLSRHRLALTPSITITSTPAASLTVQHGHDPPLRHIAPHAHHHGTAPAAPRSALEASLRR